MKLLIPMLLIALAASTLASPQASADSYRQITMQEAVALMAAQEGYAIVDVRTAQEYESGHIPGAINIPNETIFQDSIPELPDKQQLLLVYCRSGNRSRQAAAKLAALGYSNVAEFGGIHAWPGEIVIP